MEIKSILVQAIKGEIEDAKLKELFKKLAGWEKGHYAILQKEINYLQEEYFSRNNFSPF
ncbi:MAG: hypothetical protein J7K04_04070 [Spirochaetales bacterium]|nr:hypothetical protein [Spirochaetales bacterium]